jgi:hypothetical protein
MGGEAAGRQAATGVADSEHDLGVVSRAPKALRLAWGDVYTFGHDERGYRAAWPDRLETGQLCADTPEALGRLLAGDFEADPS